jgi:triose/dihydroxyacetone kinase / FAD-AMP lyase (cyclizing)
LAAPNPEREILIIFNNYTGDRLNFGLAVEMAQNIYNYKNIKVIIVDDDCAIENPQNSTGRRGLSGINLIIKIAGAMSAKGFCLNEIHEKCSSLLCNRFIRTIGFSFHHTFDDLSNIEIGYGIHGEPGALKIDRANNFKPIIEILMKKLKLCHVHSDVVVLFNNLGGASDFTFYHFIQEFLTSIKIFDFTIVKIYAGKFLTSLGKEGIGLTIMEVIDKEIIEYLDYPVNISAKELYNNLEIVHNPNVMNFYIPKNELKTAKSLVTALVNDDQKIMREILIEICSKLNEAKEVLNQLDIELGDGDTGSTLSRGSNAILNEIESGSLNLNDIQFVLRNISEILMTSMGGIMESLNV